MKNYFLPASILIAAVLISGSLIYTTGVKNQTASLIDTNPDQGSEVLLGLAEDDVVLGDRNAPVTVIIYSDPSCPFCAAAAGGNKEVMDYLKGRDPSWTPPVPGVIENYVKTGKANLAFRYFPGHGTGEETMAVLTCAGKQGGFWPLHDKVFENQDIVEQPDKVRELAGEMGIDAAQLDSCLEKGDYASKLAKDVESGNALGVRGTPAFFVNGTKLEGAYSFAQFELIINELLSR